MKDILDLFDELGERVSQARARHVLDVIDGRHSQPIEGVQSALAVLEVALRGYNEAGRAISLPAPCGHRDGHELNEARMADMKGR